MREIIIQIVLIVLILFGFAYGFVWNMSSKYVSWEDETQVCLYSKEARTLEAQKYCIQKP